MRFQMITSTQSQRLHFGARVFLKALALDFSCLVFLYSSFASAQVAVTATPTFSPAGSTYSSAQMVSINTTTPSATIYYTTNGTTPTINSTVYSGAIIVSASERVEAIATANGLSTSAVGSAAYTIGTVNAPSCSEMSLGNGASLNGFIPFPSTNAWNTNIASALVDPNSAAIVAAPGFAGWYLHPDFGAESESGIPYVVVDSTATPTVSLNVTDSAFQSDVVVAPYPVTAPIEGSPADCSDWPDTNNGGDAHVLVLDRAKCELYETYNTHRCNGQWAASSETIWDMHNYESRPWGWTSADAAGLPVLPGLVRYDEIASGAINHALGFSLEQTSNDSNGGYFVSPATHAAGNTLGTKNVMGMRIRLKASFDISGFSPVNQIILTAMQQYGLILTGNGGNFYFKGAPDPRWDDNDLANLQQIASSNFEVVQATPEFPGYDSATAPTGAAPAINSFTASASNVSSVNPVTFTYNASGDSYDYIDAIGPVSGGSVTINPTKTNTYILNSTNAYGRSVSTPITVTVPGSVVAAPTFTPVAGTYSSPQMVTINTPTSPSATIYYTTNGTTPTTSSTEYSGPITVSVTQTLRAIATATGYSAPSAMGSAGYTIDEMTKPTSMSIAVKAIAISSLVKAITIGGLAAPITLSGLSPAITGTSDSSVKAMSTTAQAGGGTSCTSDGNTVTLGGTAYGLCAHPRGLLNPSLITSIQNTSPTGKANSANPPYASMVSTVNSFVSTYGPSYAPGITYFYNQVGYDTWSQCLNAALLWESQGEPSGDPNGYLALAKYCINHVEEFDASSMGCDQTRSQCGRSFQWGYGQWWAWKVGQIFSIVRSQLTSGQIQTFAAKLFNDNANTNNGLGGTASSLGTNCTPQPFTYEGSGVTLVASTSTNTVTVTGTPSPALAQGGVLFAYNWTGYSDAIGVINTVVGNTVTLYSNALWTYSGTFYYSPAWSNNCGIVWNLKNNQNFPENLIPSQSSNWATSYPTPGAALGEPANDNLIWASTNGWFQLALDLADDDVRASTFATQLYNNVMTGGTLAEFPDSLSRYTGFTTLSASYSNGQQAASIPTTQVVLNNSLVSGPQLAGSYFPKREALEFIYITTPGFTSGGGVTATNGTPAWATHYQSTDAGNAGSVDIAVPVLTYYLGGTNEGNYLNWYYLQPIANGGRAYMSGWATFGGSYLAHNFIFQTPPAAYTQVDYRSALTTQFRFAQTDLATCQSLGFKCPTSSGSAMPMEMMISKSDWTANATMAMLYSGTWIGGDHIDSLETPAYHIIRNGYSLLAGDGGQDNGGVAPCYSYLGGQRTEDTVEIGSVANYGITFNAFADCAAVATTTRWAATSQSTPDTWAAGVTSNNYAYAQVDHTANYNAGGVTLAQRDFLHFKKSGEQDYIISYDDIATSTPEYNEAYFNYLTGCSNANGTVSDNSGGAITLTTAASRLNTSFLPVQGTNTIAVLYNGNSYPSNSGICSGSGATYQVAVGASTNGSTLNTSATSGEWIAVHQPCNGTSCTMPAITQPSCAAAGGNCTAVQIADSSSPKVAVFARQGVTLTGAAFTSTHSGTAQYLIAGLAPGNYSVSVNGTTVVSSVTVNANDNTLYFESTAGAVQISSSLTSPQAFTPAFTPAAGTYSSAQTVTISTTTPSATIYYTTDGSTPTTNSAVYSAPITVSATETLQAIAVASGYSNSSAGSATYTITSAGATTTSLTASPNPVATGQTLTLTATVQGTDSTTPGGTVSFLSGSTPLGTAPVNSSGVATLTLTTLAVGTYSITAQYSGNASFLSSTSTAASATVYSQATTTTLTAFPSPVAPGQILTLTATVQGNGSTAPAGAINFMNGSTQLGTATLNSSGVATLATASLATGIHSLTAQYAGNATYFSSTSAVVSVTVSNQASTTSLTASPNPVTAGQTLTLTAAVQGTGSTTPGGTVNFMSGSTLMGTATLNSSGVATLTTTSLAAGTYSLTALYSGDANFVSSTSTAVSVTVNTQATTNQSFTLNVTGSAISQTVQPGKTAIYTLTVSPAPGTTLPAITFTAAGLPAGYTAIFSPPNIAAGSGATNVTLTIQVPLQAAVLERDRKLHAGLSLVALCILLLPFGGRLRRSGKRMLQLSGIVLLLAGAASLIGLTGCTAPLGQFASQNAQTYTVTVITTSGSQSQTANVTLIVE